MGRGRGQEWLAEGHKRKQMTLRDIQQKRDREEDVLQREGKAENRYR
jgi:hypothetical protein